MIVELCSPFDRSVKHGRRNELSKQIDVTSEKRKIKIYALRRDGRKLANSTSDTTAVKIELTLTWASASTKMIRSVFVGFRRVPIARPRSS